jgi:hypothetical protein
MHYHNNKQYLKYKKRYLALRGGFVPDEEIKDDEAVEFNEDTEEIEDEEKKEKVESELEEDIEYIGDTNITTEKINKVVSIAKIHGKMSDYSNFDDDEFAYKLFPNKSKIIAIINKDIFDQFTEKFGMLKKILKIDWERVMKDYRGIYVSSSIEERTNDAPFLGKVFTSWIINEYKYIDNVVIFLNEDEAKYEKRLTYPFKGYIMDYYAIDENSFVSINEKITHDKILVINSIKHFDQFTHKYSDGKNIIWDKVKVDYIGFYIGDDINLKSNRYAKCFYNDKMVIVGGN